jgi:hypothetical protein
MTTPPSPNLPEPEPPSAADSGLHAETDIFRSPSLIFSFLRICLYLLLVFGITFALEWSFAPFTRGISFFAPRRLITDESVLFAGTLAAAWAMSRLEKRPLGAYGLPLRGAFGKFFWQGMLFGVGEISVVVGCMAALGGYHFGALAVHGTDLVRWAALWAIFFLVVGLYEEFSYRGYLQFTLARSVGFWPAAALLSIAFGVVHISNPNENWRGIAGVVLTGLLWCLTLRRTGGLWLAVGMHAGFDFGETFLYSVPDSGIIFPGHLSNATFAGPAWLTGGDVGPEASVFDFIVLLLLFYVFHRLYPAGPQKKTSAAA